VRSVAGSVLPFFGRSSIRWRKWPEGTISTTRLIRPLGDIAAEIVHTGFGYRGDTRTAVGESATNDWMSGILAEGIEPRAGATSQICIPFSRPGGSRKTLASGWIRTIPTRRPERECTRHCRIRRIESRLILRPRVRRGRWNPTIIVGCGWRS
jgi:hypothetical protein